jgi:two-component system nitrate/nitrite response regulator NarL
MALAPASRKSVAADLDRVARGEAQPLAMTDQPVVRVFVLGAVTLHRQALVRLLDEHERIHVVGSAAPGSGAVDRITATAPDIVLLDAPAPARAAHARGVAAAAPTARVVALGVPEVDEEVLCCAEAGISGYVTPDAGVTDLVATLVAVGRGELRCSARIAATLMKRVAALADEVAPAVRLADLTRRERDVLGLVGRGLTNKEIAQALGVAPATVKTHVHRLLAKLGVRRRTDLVALAASTPPRAPNFDHLADVRGNGAP